MTRKRWLMLVAVAAVAIIAGVLAWGLSGSTLTATVVDKRTGEPLPKVVAKVDDESISTSDGRVDVKIALGTHTVEFAAAGYETVSRTVEARIFRAADLGEVPLRNADLVIKVVENFPGEPPVKAARLEVAGETSMVRRGDAVTIEGLAIGPTTLKATARDYEPTNVELELTPGSNEVVVSLTPEMLVVVRRAIQASFDHDHLLNWELLHPDRQRLHGSRAAYLKKRRRAVDELLDEGIVPQRFKVLTPFFVKRYHDKATGKTYKDAYRVPITIWAGAPQLAIFNMKSMAVTQDSYWVKTDEGRWVSLGDGESVDK